ncbi:MAG TPA: GNAT family N-acetyltransferase [Gaiellaceae bacterium]|nr:GNAT family N-acetyltransferase [Gaiellaceae bacterium]
MNLRAPTLDDVPDITRLFNRGSAELFDEADESEDDVGRFMTSVELDLEEDIRVAEADGEIVGYADIYAHPHPTYWVDVRVAPSDESHLRAQLLDWSLGRVREKGGERVMGFAWAQDERMRRALGDAAFERTRGSYRMGIEFEGELEKPRPPDGVRIRPMRPEDAQVAHETHEETFQDMWGYAPTSFEDWQHWFLGDDHDWSLFFLAEADGEPAGVALCRPRPTEPQIGSIRVVGVRRPWRRKGVGRALMLHAFAEFRLRGMRGASLGVDAESLTGAQRLYASVGMHVDRESDIFERALS